MSIPEAPVVDVLGVGHALVDVLAEVGDDLIDALALTKGSMRLVELDEAERLQGALGPTTQVSGGSAANTMAGVAALGGSAGYLCRVGDDALGQAYARDLERVGVGLFTPPPAVNARGRAATGRCVVLVTPDGERTMSTYLGAGAGLGPDDVDAARLPRAGVVYLEGYLWDSASAVAAVEALLALARPPGAKVALSLSDPLCVSRHRPEFLALVEGGGGSGVDIVFANEDEICLLYQTDDFEQAAGALRATGVTGALTRGGAGSVIVAGSATVRVAAEPVAQVVDTTGAGDLYAAGFLYGVTHGMGMAECARLGGLAASEVIGHLGARPLLALVELVRAAGLWAPPAGPPPGRALRGGSSRLLRPGCPPGDPLRRRGAGS